jgi:hypothetical protein
MPKDSSQIISVSVDVVALDESLHLKFPDAKMEEYFIVITLTNTQDTTVPIVTMTCSWEDSFTFDRDSLHLFYPGCDSNFPIWINILPHKSVKFFGKLRLKGKRHDHKDPYRFKIGFADLPSRFRGPEFRKKGEPNPSIYWSDNIYLTNRLYQYETEEPANVPVAGNGQ